MTWGTSYFVQQFSSMKTSLRNEEEFLSKKNTTRSSSSRNIRSKKRSTTTTARLGISALPKVQELDSSAASSGYIGGAYGDHMSVTSEITMEPLPPAPKPHDSTPLDDVAQEEHQHATITLKPSCYTSTEALIHYQSKRIQSLELRSRVDEEELEGLRRKYQELQSVHQMSSKEWEIRQERYDRQIQYLTDRMECFERYLKVVDETEIGDDGSSSVPMLIEESVNSSSFSSGGGDSPTSATTTPTRTSGLFRSLRSSKASTNNKMGGSSIHDSVTAGTTTADSSFSSDSYSRPQTPTNTTTKQLNKAQQTIRALMGQIQLVERMLGEETNSLREQLLQQQQVQVRMESEYQLQLQQLQHSKRQLERTLLEHHKRATAAKNNQKESSSSGLLTTTTTATATLSSSTMDGTDTDATPKA